MPMEIFPGQIYARTAHMCINAPEPCSIELAHEIIYGGLEYAQRLGFQPHRDFTAQFCDQVLDPPESHPAQTK